MANLSIKGSIGGRRPRTPLPHLAGPPSSWRTLLSAVGSGKLASPPVAGSERTSALAATVTTLELTRIGARPPTPTRLTLSLPLAAG